MRNLRKEVRESERLVKEQSRHASLLRSQTEDIHKCLDNVTIKLNEVKGVTQALKQERSDLLQERNILKARSEVGLDDLTPRPNYQAIMIEKKLELNISYDPYTESNDLICLLVCKQLHLEKKTKTRLSTEQVVTALVTKIYAGSARSTALRHATKIKRNQL